ncbi:hypothetical protein QL285_090288 [Trifolium repens]|nr:hypothetical protein QL285_090288 [Trifolium repens]
MDEISPAPQMKFARKQVTKKGNVPSTKRKLPHGKKPKSFNKSTKRELPHWKKPKPFKENVQSIKGELPHGKKPMPFKEWVRKVVAKAGFRDKVAEPNMYLILNGLQPPTSTN